MNKFITASAARGHYTTSGNGLVSPQKIVQKNGKIVQEIITEVCLNSEKLCQNCAYVLQFKLHQN